jgi:hypothetical protein
MSTQVPVMLFYRHYVIVSLKIDTFEVCICMHAHASKVKDVACLTNKKWHRCRYCYTTKWEEGRRNCSSNSGRRSGRTLLSACTRHLACPSNQSYLLLLRLRLRLLVFLFFIAFTSLAVVDACLPYKHSSSFCRWWYGWRARFPLFGLRSLARPNLVMHSNWPLLHVYTNGDAERLKEGGREKRRRWRRRRRGERELLLIVVTTRQHTAIDERRERRVFFFFFSFFFFYFFVGRSLVISNNSSRIETETREFYPNTKRIWHNDV